MKSSELTIGEVARRFGLPTHVLRHWESEGLLSPVRSASTHRRYATEDLYQVASILRAKEAGLSLPDIREFLTARTPSSRKEVLKRQHKILLDRLAGLQAAISLLETGIACGHEDIMTCPNYRSHLEERVSAAGPS